MTTVNFFLCQGYLSMTMSQAGAIGVSVQPGGTAS